MSYYDNNQQWSAQGGDGQLVRWNEQTPPARSGASSANPREESGAFSSQIEEVDRAVENLVKSRKMCNMPGRRESMPVGPLRNFNEQFDPRMTGGARHHSVTDFGDARSYTGSNLQNFYASQRHQPSRPSANEAEQVMQAKRRMAAQRERELRNYHQEQQYNRSIVVEISNFGAAGAKPDRTLSPGSSMSDEERRELIARQRNALYHPSDSPFDESGSPRPGSGTPSTKRGHSPLAAFEPFTAPSHPDSSSTLQTPIEPPSQSSQQPQRSRANSTSSPCSAQNTSSSTFSTQQQSTYSQSRTSTSSPGGSPPRKAPTGPSNIAPIGTRPAQAQAQNPALREIGKRSTTPLPSPLSYGFASSNEEGKAKEGSPASAGGSGSQGGNDLGMSGTTAGPGTSGLGWGSSAAGGAGTGVWGGKALGVQASVWG